MTTLHFTRTTDLVGPLYYATDQFGFIYVAMALPRTKGWYGTIRNPQAECLWEVDWTGFDVHVDEMLKHLGHLAQAEAQLREGVSV